VVNRDILAAKLAELSDNVVAHGYAGVDVQLVYDAATAGLADLESFAQQVASWLSAAP
jgi:uncharacterized protein YutE (UPF0331/DUF86 family)